VLAAKLHTLYKAEAGLAERLQRDGLSAEAALCSAFAFVRGCVEHYSNGCP
jgi:hypothetical protein